MRGRQLHDPLGLEGAPGSHDGLGLLDCETTLEPEKQLRNVTGALQLPARPAFTGYEIHMGTTRGAALENPAVLIADGRADGRADGAQSADGRIIASYCHGLFDHPDALCGLLAWAGMHAPMTADFAQRRAADIERLADATEAALDWTVLDTLLGTATNHA
jgi:adenosylcobyric acid synthase